MKRALTLLLCAVMLTALFGCEEKKEAADKPAEKEAKADDKEKPADEAGDEKVADKAGDEKPTEEPAEPVEPPKPQLTPEQASCDMIFDKMWKVSEPYWLKLGLEAEDATAEAKKLNEKAFFKKCGELTDIERVCVAMADYPMAAARDCKVENKLSFKFPFKKVTAFEKAEMDATASAAELEKLVGTWVGDNSASSWKETYTIDANGAVKQVKTSEGKEDKVSEWEKISFRKEGEASFKKGSSTQFVPYYNAGDKFYVYFNTANDLHKVEKEDAFILDLYKRYVFFVGSTCKVLDAGTMIDYDATCAWEDKDGARFFNVEYKSLAGYPSGTVKESWLKEGNWLLNPHRARNRYIKQ